MSTTITSITTPALHSARPDFFGTVRGELFKISRQWTTWIVLVLLTGIIFLPYLIRLTVSNTKDAINHDTLAFLYGDMSNNLAILRAFAGFALIILTARVIGLEYQLGTIRILLARGVGRLQLLSAKLLTMVIIALAIFVGGILLNLLLTLFVIGVTTGNLDALSKLTPGFWDDTRLYLLTVLASFGVTILMTTAVTVLGRSLSFGLSFGLSWFAADNLGTAIMGLAFEITHNDFWRNITAYFLGPNLNVMASQLLPIHVFTLGTSPLVNVDGTHTLVVTLVYAIIFLALAIVLTWRRDVKE